MRRPRREYRRRRLLVVAIGLTVAVLVVQLVSRGFGDGPDERLAYLDAVRPAVELSNRLALDLEDLRAQAPTLERSQLELRLERMRTGTEDSVSRVEGVQPPDSLLREHGLLVATLTVRARAALEMAQAFDDAISPTPDEAARRLAQLGADLGVSDRTYALFQEATEPFDDSGAVLESVWLADPSVWSLDAVNRFVAAMRRSGALAEVRDVSIVAVRLVPPPIGTEGDLPVLPTADPFAVEVVIENKGSQVEIGVGVIATLVSEADGSTVTREATVDLEPGQRRTVTLGDVAPAPGGAANLVVKVGPVPGETADADNEHRSTYVVKGPATQPATTSTSTP